VEVNGNIYKREKIEFAVERGLRPNMHCDASTSFTQGYLYNIFYVF